MLLKVINSNSDGNAYLLESKDEILLIECGVPIDQIKKAINYNVRKVVGCLITHEHKDHCKAAPDVVKNAINVYATFETLAEIGIASSHRSHIIEHNKQFSVGNFSVIPFSIQHDAADPVGFVINHAECGNLLFLTDSYYCKHRFKNLNNVIIEANYCWKIINDRVAMGQSEKFVRDRVLSSHLSIQNCIDLLGANDLTNVQNIVLIHLSDHNSNASQFQQRVQEATGKMVYVAEAGLHIQLNKKIF